MEAIEAGVPFVVESKIANCDRAVGARLAGELAVRRAQSELPADVTFNLNGTAGQSFGAFTVEGMKLVLKGRLTTLLARVYPAARLLLRPVGWRRRIVVSM